MAPGSGWMCTGGEPKRGSWISWAIPGDRQRPLAQLGEPAGGDAHGAQEGHAAARAAATRTLEPAPQDAPAPAPSPAPSSRNSKPRNTNSWPPTRRCCARPAACWSPARRRCWTPWQAAPAGPARGQPVHRRRIPGNVERLLCAVVLQGLEDSARQFSGRRFLAPERPPARAFNEVMACATLQKLRNSRGQACRAANARRSGTPNTPRRC